MLQPVHEVDFVESVVRLAMVLNHQFFERIYIAALDLSNPAHSSEASATQLSLELIFVLELLEFYLRHPLLSRANQIILYSNKIIKPKVRYLHMYAVPTASLSNLPAYLNAPN